MPLHVDTDFAGDPDDACALAMLLGDADAEVVGVTTALEDGGRRHDCLRAVLEMVGGADIPTAAGLGRTLTGGQFGCTWNDRRHWPEVPQRTPTPAGSALDLLERSISSGAVLVAIGGFTNLAALEISRPGVLADARIVAMGGWIDDPGDGWPQWGPAADFNTQSDVTAAEIVVGAAGSLTLVTLPVAMQAVLRRSDLERLRSSGPVGRMLARQSEANFTSSDLEGEVALHRELPTDLVNFHWDPVTAGVALGWECISTRSVTLTTATSDGVLEFVASAAPGPDAVSIAIDAEDFRERWIERIEALDAR